jgi:hemoglobin-like flavoprotein
MTPETVALVQGSFRQVAPIADAAADIFYGRLFEAAPELRPLFPADMTEQKKKLMQMLAAAVNNLHQAETVTGAIQDLGRRHGGYGVTAPMYGRVGAALLYTLETGLGDAWTPDVVAAWTETFGLVAEVMQSVEAA